MYLVPFLNYSTSNNGVTLKAGLDVVQLVAENGAVRYHIRLTIGRPL